jgi:hypothetical protein
VGGNCLSLTASSSTARGALTVPISPLSKVMTGCLACKFQSHLYALFDRSLAAKSIREKSAAPHLGFASLARAGKTYRLRISNVGLQNTLNLMMQDHSMTLVEVEGTHTVQNSYASLDVHVGQSLSVLFDADRPARDYHVVVSTRFTNTTLRSTAVVRYAGSSGRAFGSLPLPAGPGDVEFSLNQARSIRFVTR